MAFADTLGAVGTLLKLPAAKRTRSLAKCLAGVGIAALMLGGLPGQGALPAACQT